MGDGSDTRANFGVEGEGRLPVGPGDDATSRASFDPGRIDFGHYAGQTIAELAKRDPDYLRWLARHPSGARYRAEIERVLGRMSMIPGE